MMMKAVVIYGAGGHGKVVLDILERSGYEIVGFVDDDRARAGTAHCGYPIFADPRDAGSGRALDLIVAIGDPRTREQVTERALALGFSLATAVHPSAAIGRDVEIGAGAMILAHAAVNPGTRIGRGVIINTAATVDHDCAIGDFAHIAPGARLAGHVRVGERAVVGIGAAVIPGVTIGAAAVVGAGAVVVRDVPAQATVAGVPAKRVASRRTRKRGEGR